MPVTIYHLSTQDRCDDVFALYRKDTGTLGFMPRGAFEEGIAKGTLLVATDDQNQILGYLEPVPESLIFWMRIERCSSDYHEII